MQAEVVIKNVIMKIKALLVGIVAITVMMCTACCSDDEPRRTSSETITASVESFTISSPYAERIQFTIVVKASKEPEEGGLCYIDGKTTVPTISHARLLLYPNNNYSTVSVLPQQDGTVKITGTIDGLNSGWATFRPYMKFSNKQVVYGTAENVYVQLIDIN